MKKTLLVILMLASIPLTAKKVKHSAEWQAADRSFTAAVSTQSEFRRRPWRMQDQKTRFEMMLRRMDAERARNLAEQKEKAK